MKKRYLFYLVLLFSFLAISFESIAADDKVIIYVEGSFDMNSIATAEGREMANLLGHFSIQPLVKGVNLFNANEARQCKTVFYIGNSNNYKISAEFKNFALNSGVRIVWINTGANQLGDNFFNKFGFKVIKYFENSNYSVVKRGADSYTKGSGKINIIQLIDRKKVNVLATTSGKGQVEVPYIITSGNFTYIADSPFEKATETDRYLLFSDLLHDIIGINHAPEHKAMVRIEDINPTSDPNKLRDIADILSEKGIPFLVGVVPFYVNPAESQKISLSERPEVVDALKYMVANGGTIVMHGSTHQYKGVTTADFEFWDGSNQRPIADLTNEDIANKVESGIEEFMKNGLYPVLWETPHYTASLNTYTTVAKYFSTAIEQRMAIEKFEYGQYFPYIIQKDIYGQKLYPENLGYVPVDANQTVSWNAAKNIIEYANYIKRVRDGYATFFFHAFIDLKILADITENIKNEGFQYVNVRNDKNWVKLHDRIILTGSQSYTLTLNNSYLTEIYYNEKGDIVNKIVSKNRIIGNITKTVDLKPGWFYVAEPAEYLYEKPTFTEQFMSGLNRLTQKYFGNSDEWSMMHPVVMWNSSARGAAFMDQSSLVSSFRSLNIPTDTLFIGEKLSLSQSNILVVPFAVVDSLKSDEVNAIIKFVQAGGNLITDRRSKLSEKLGFAFSNIPIKVGNIRDKVYPQEYIAWKYKELTFKFAGDKNDNIYCEDPASGNAMVVGRNYGKGKILFINSLFDPYSLLGYSRYPFIMEHIRSFFSVKPFIRRDNLDVFFDPGLRPNISVEALVKTWVASGVRYIHVSGWHEYPKYTYDYARLIKLCHANGILVYAWVEPPQVNLKFWTNHPEWREKNYMGQDARPAWRYPVALTDNECVKAVIAEYQKFFAANDFDGVNLGEVYFESGRGFIDPLVFTPMHPSAIKEMQELYHFDAKNIFNASSSVYWKNNAKVRESVVAYRVAKTKEVNEKFIQAFTEIAKAKPGFQVIVTTMDTYNSPELKEYIGLDIDDIIDLQKKYKFSLQVEDPASRWSTDPSRYVDMGKLFAPKVTDDSQLMLDLNILTVRNRHDVTPFPTLIQTGIESYQLIKHASLGSPRYTIYAEGSVNPQDLSMFAYASASEVKYENETENGFEVNSPYSFTLRLPEAKKAIYVDDQPIIGYRDNLYFIPAGKHTIKYADQEMLGFSSALIQPQVLSLSGNVTDIRYGMKNVTVSYTSTTRTILSLNRKPEKVTVDGQDYKFEVMKGNDCFSIYLPEGEHKVDVVTGSNMSYSVDITSLWSSSVIVFFGAFGVLLLVCMYVFMKIYRRIVE